ncbi:MAG: hypothetical protein MR410_06355 [Eubacterium sp.]|nr:hypothetical protein [Eubacterium sp.]
MNGNQRIDEQNTEANSIKEQTVYYDVRFGAILPEGKEPIRIIINLEIQLDDHPGYPIVKRGFYYCGRMISEQYGKLEKVYSIRICPDPAKKRKNGIFRYHTVEETIIGTSCTQSDDYDMMEVIILNLGDTNKDGEPEILNLLNVLFSPTISPEEKKQKLQEQYHIAMTEELESEVRTMCNLSEGLVEMGIEQGIEYGKEQGIKQGIEQKNLLLAQMMLEDHEPIDKIQKYTGYTIDVLKEIEKMIKKQ